MAAGKFPIVESGQAVTFGCGGTAFGGEQKVDRLAHGIELLWTGFRSGTQRLFNSGAYA